MQRPTLSQIAQTNLSLCRQLRDASVPADDIAAVHRDYLTAVELLGSRVRSTGRPFLCHVVGTASVTAFQTGDIGLVRAGLLHAAFTHGVFPGGGSGDVAPHRAWLASRTDPAVFERVLAYARFDMWKTRLDAALDRPAGLSDGDREMLLLRLANEVDDMIEGSEWIGGKRADGGAAEASRLAAAARGLGFDVLGLLLDDLAQAAPAFDWVGSLPRCKRPPRMPTRLGQLRSRLGRRLDRRPA